MFNFLLGLRKQNKSKKNFNGINKIGKMLFTKRLCFENLESREMLSTVYWTGANATNNVADWAYNSGGNTNWRDEAYNTVLPNAGDDLEWKKVSGTISMEQNENFARNNGS